jgi:alpha-tubulin suppressor-like RCC1 family protein
MLSEIITLFSNKITQTISGLFTLGFNNNGQIGNNTQGSVYYSSPVLVNSSVWLKSCSTQNFNVAIKSDFTLWSWGNNNTGQLGISATTSRSSPVQIGSFANWKDVAAGGYAANSGYAAAINTSGELYTWGNNENGQLGLNLPAGPPGTGTNRSSPIQVGTDSDWNKIFANYNQNNNSQMIAIKNNNTIYTWGGNGSGSLGVGDTISRSSPVQIGSIGNWYTAAIYDGGVIAVKTDGTLWSWGSNGFGNLGQNTGFGADLSSPVQIGADTNWVWAFTSQTSCWALKSNGTLWGWGSNFNGQLGINRSLTGYSSPVQVGSYVYVLPLGQMGIFIKQDGTLWASGTPGSFGILPATRSSPVQISIGTYVSTRIPTVANGGNSHISLLKVS